MKSRIVLAVVALLSTSMAGQQSPPTATAGAADYQLSIAFSANTGPNDRFNPATLLYLRWPVRSTLALGYINYRHPAALHDVAAALDEGDL